MEIINKTEIKQELERQVCKEHKTTPKVTVTADGFTFDSCCDNFNEELINLASELATQNAADNIADQLSNSLNF